MVRDELCIGTEEYSLAQQHEFKLIKPGYIFQLYSHYQAYLQSLAQLRICVKFYAFNTYSSTGDCR
jgi:hypothetical protein